MMQAARKFRYCVLYIHDAERHRLLDIFRKALPKERGEVFYPLMEYYRRDDREVHTRAIFPGYIFFYTDLNMKEVHELVRSHRSRINSGYRELALASQRMADEDFLLREDENQELFELSDADEEETVFLDHLREGNGLLAMSSGYEYRDTGPDGRSLKKYTVMEGPLQAYEKRIRNVDKHNRRAYLEFEINGRRAQAGFSCLPKAHWYPDEDSRIVKFEDGTEADLSELKRSIMSIK